MTSRLLRFAARTCLSLTVACGAAQVVAGSAETLARSHVASDVLADPVDNPAEQVGEAAPTLAPPRPESRNKTGAAKDATAHVTSGSDLPIAPAATPSEAAATLPSADGGIQHVSSGTKETIVERNPDGSKHIEREVRQDADGNFVNHGVYTAYNATGQIVARGRYAKGKLDGHWVRTLKSEDANRLSADIGKGFRPPFYTEASFNAGTLSGPWTLKSGMQQKIVEWNYVSGMCHGEATWFFPNGQKRAQVTFKGGVPDGDFLEWDESGNASNRGKFIEGRLLTHMVRWHAPGQKAFEGYYLKPQSIDVPSPDWWTGAHAIISKSTPIEVKGSVPGSKQGLWTAWYPNGQKQSEGEFRDDLPTGKFVWWHSNGQKQAEGTYLNGVEDGTWLTWYSNGQRETAKQYHVGDIVGKSLVWDQTGRLINVRDFESQPGNQRGVRRQASVNESQPTVGATNATKR